MDEIDDSGFELALARRAGDVEAELDRLLGASLRDGEVARPGRLLAAVRYGVLNGGKRLRPFLLMESAALFEADGAAALRAAAALECVHCYSLIHDDLPAMDDDDLRRGVPTLHRAYDEATAILAGDSLLTFAFDILADEETAIEPERRLALVGALARAAGMGGMAGGQALDLQAEREKPDETGIIRLQAMKTGALMHFACEAGAIIGGAQAREREILGAFGAALGLAFQLSDDLLDTSSSAEVLGKTPGKDEAAGKATLVALHGADWARAQLDGLVAQASALLEPFGERAGLLRRTAAFLASRAY